MLWIRNDLFRIQLRDFNTVVPDPSKRFVFWILIPDPTPIILNILNCYRYGITLKEHSSLFSVQLKKNIFYLLFICFYNFLGIRIRKQSVRIQKKGPNPTGFGFTTVIVVLRFVLYMSDYFFIITILYFRRPLTRWTNTRLGWNLRWWPLWARDSAPWISPLERKGYHVRHPERVKLN